jgi:hypothetical protein
MPITGFARTQVMILESASLKPIKVLFSFHCGNCVYMNIHDIATLIGGCGKGLKGGRVYQKIGDTVVFDSRDGRKRKNRRN